MPDSIAYVIGRAVRRARRARDWSQEEAARQLRLAGLPWHRWQLTDLESGRRAEIGLSEALLLAETFDLPLADLVPHSADDLRLGTTARPANVVRSRLDGGHPNTRGVAL